MRTEWPFDRWKAYFSTIRSILLEQGLNTLARYCDVSAARLELLIWVLILGESADVPEALLMQLLNSSDHVIRTYRVATQPSLCLLHGHCSQKQTHTFAWPPSRQPRGCRSEVLTSRLRSLPGKGHASATLSSAFWAKDFVQSHQPSLGVDCDLTWS